MTESRPVLRILGIRGIPAAHGGFETFAEKLAPYLVHRGWRVIVYCQEHGTGEPWHDTWQGVERFHIPIAGDGAAATMQFDLQSILHARKSEGLCLTLGYNTACFWPLLRVKGIRNVANMDGIEWRRGKWSTPVKAWFWLNDWIGCFTAHHLIADHPEIEKLLRRRVHQKHITQIAYGADRIEDVGADALAPLGLESGQYMTLIARAEPENSVLEAVQGFSMRPRGIKLAVLGNYAKDNEYHQRVIAAAGDEVLFLGPIYDKDTVRAIRAHCLAYVHGHQVGGTNPSLVEALGAGNPVIAHDNAFNRWVTDEGAAYFKTAADADHAFTRLAKNLPLRLGMSQASLETFEERFTWEGILARYEATLKSELVGGGVKEPRSEEPRAARPVVPARAVAAPVTPPVTPPLATRPARQLETLEQESYRAP